MQKVFFLGTPKNIYTRLVHFWKEDFEWIFCDSPKDIINFQEDSILFLFSPIKMDNQFYTIESIWKSYLRLNYSESKLIVIGINNLKNSNYIDLFNLPKNIRHFIKKAKKIDKDWTFITIEDFNIKKRLLRFLDGHGDDSIIDVLIKLNRIIIIINDELKRGIPYEELYSDFITLDNTLKPWNAFKRRWNSHFLNFQFLPFTNQVNTIIKAMENLDPYFHDKCTNGELFKKIDCAQNIDTIKTELMTIEKYVKN